MLGAAVSVTTETESERTVPDSVTVENTTPQGEQVEGQTSLAALAALGMTAAPVELRALVAGLVSVAVAVSGIELDVVATLLWSAASGYT